MTSAVDTRDSTDSLAASDSKSFGKNPPARARMNAIACEVAVIATGARSSENGERELFTEETTTALVFENGGVLRLSASVILGQLLFLTHKETKCEVVAQVTAKRNFQPTIFYVEVAFSEPSPGFWGMEFCKTPVAVAAKAPLEMAEETAREEIVRPSDQPDEPASAPSAQEISALKGEVDELRKQLKLLQTQAAARTAPARAVIPDLSGPTSPEPPSASAVISPQAPAALPGAPREQLLKPPNGAGAVPQEAPVNVSGGLASSHAAPSPAPSSPSISPAEPKQKGASNGRSATLRKDLLFAAFVLIVAGAAWYQNLLPWLPLPRNIVSSSAPSIAPQPASHRTPKRVDASASAGQPRPISETAAAPPGTDTRDASQPGPSRAGQTSADGRADTRAVVQSAPDAGADAPSRPEKSEASAAAKRNSGLLPERVALVSAAPLSDGAAIVPPKLIKSVRAIASPNALQDFGAGSADNVTFDALVDASGHVKSMKALSGSAALQNAAMEALKQYQYEPATRQGKPVPAHVTVGVKFLFEP